MPSSKISYLKKKCDTLTRERILSIGRCQICGATFNLEPCHFISRRDIRLRYDERNLICACHDDHMKGHSAPRWWREQFVRIKGPDVVEWLEMESRKPPRPVREDFYREVLLRR